MASLYPLMSQFYGTYLHFLFVMNDVGTLRIFLSLKNIDCGAYTIYKILDLVEYFPVVQLWFHFHELFILIIPSKTQGSLWRGWPKWNSTHLGATSLWILSSNWTLMCGSIIIIKSLFYLVGIESILVEYGIHFFLLIYVNYFINISSWINHINSQIL